MTYVLPPPNGVSLPVAGTADRFPVHRIYCVGRNYAAHAREMGKDPEREPPFFFCKPADSLVTDGRAAAYPARTADLHHEVELVVALGRGGTDISRSAALDHIYGYAVGVDLTRRDLQAEAKNMSRPWDVAKGFDDSAPCGTVVPVAHCGHPGAGQIWLTVGGSRRQSGDLAEMIWSIPETIAELSSFFRLCPGDLIFTGTPAGVGPLLRGDSVKAGIEGLGEIAFEIV